jgi:hypothetical protein
MREQTIKIYTFSELSDKAKEKAKSDHAEEFGYDLEPFVEGIKEDLAKLGYHDLDIRYSLGHCQGDGVAFYTKNVDAFSILQRMGISPCKAEKISNEIFVTITKNKTFHLYDHYNTMDVNIEEQNCRRKRPLVEETINKLEEFISKELKALSCKFEANGYEAIEYQNSDEYFSELSACYNWEYYEDGNFYR